MISSRFLPAFVVVLGLVGGACGSDPKPRPDAAPDAGRLDAAATDGPRMDSAPAEGGVPGMCVGTFTTYSRTTLQANSSAGGMCANSADLDIICSTDLGAVTREEGAACFGLGLTQEAQLVMCVAERVKMRLNPDLTDACLGCYTQVVACTLRNCVAQCGLMPGSAACIMCQTTAGCLPAFFMCSGLPAGPAPDGGVTPDSGVTDGAAGDGAPGDGAAPDGGVADAAGDGAGADGADDAAGADAADDGAAADGAGDDGAGDDGAGDDGATD